MTMGHDHNERAGRIGRACRGGARRIRKAAPRALSVFLALVLAFQCFMNDGVTYAIAEALENQDAATLAAGDGGPGGQAEGEGNDQADEPGQPPAGGTGNEQATDGDDGTAEKGGAEAPQDGSGQTGSGEGEKADGPSQPQSGEPSQPSGGSEGQGGSEGTKPVTPAERTEPLAWESDLDALELSSKGLTITPDQSAGATEVPERVAATLNLSFNLDAAKHDGFAEDTRASVIAGDTISVPLPQGLAAAEEGTKYDVFQLDDEGNPTSVRIAKAAVAGGTLKVTFVSPTDTSDGTSYLAGAAGADKDTARLPVLRGSIDVPVTVETALAGDEATELAWTLQTGADGATRTAQLPIPSATELAQLLGVTAPEGEDAEAAEPAPQADEVVTEPEVSVVAGAFNAQTSLTITWCDNNSGNRPSASSLAAGFVPEYSIDGGATYRPLVGDDGKVTAQAKEDLHLTDEQVARLSSPFVDVSQTGVGTYEVLSHALPGSVVTTTKTPVKNDDGTWKFDEDGQVFSTTTESAPVSWRLTDKNQYPGYIDGQGTVPHEHLYKMLTSKVTFNVVGKVGDQKLSEIFGSAQKSYFQFSATIDDKPQGSISVAQAVEEGWLTIQDTEDGCVVSGDLPMYSQDGYPIVYSVSYAGPQDTDDYYQPAYDNTASVSHGGADGAVYDGGTLTLRHVGTTDYHATKEWLDNGSENRPEVTFSLWRYSLNGGSASTASPVSVPTGDEGNPGNAAATFVTVTLPAGSADTVDLHALLKQAYGDAIDQLPKYDPDGYPYVYALREDAVAGYEQVFGHVGEDGSVNDTPPTYEATDGSWVRLDADERPSNDRLIYNAGDDPNEGIVSNRLTGTSQTQMTKTWKIAAFQDSLKDVVCEFTAQSRPKGSDEAWENVTGANATQTLTGWNAETLTKTVSASFPRYDEHGRELEYRWVESNVTVAGQDTGFTANDDGTASFSIQVSDPEGNPETLEFTSTPETGEDGTTTITNTFANITDQHVDKYWEQPDGSLAQIAPDPAYDDGIARVELYRDGQRIGTFELDGLPDATPTPVAGLGDASWQETSSYHGDFANLPKYAPDGTRYTYLVLEVNKEGWTTERTYDAETRTTRIDNNLPVGEGSEIRLSKYWLDGDDAAHRYDVRLELVAARDLRSQATNLDGTPRVTYAKDQVVATVDLSEQELWFTEVDVPIGGLTINDFYVREVALVDDNDTPATDDDVSYPVLTRDEAQANPEYADELWLNAGWTNPENLRVATPEHVYEVRTRTNAELGSLEVTNRRLGLLDLTVTKDWRDGLGDDPADNPRPEATLTLSCQEYPEAFSLNDEGELQVSVSGNTLPVTTADGTPVKATIVDADGNPAEHGSALVEVDTAKAGSTYEFFGLPKYDASGLNVHYDVSEGWVGDSGHYHSSKTVGDYVVEDGARHFHDTQRIDFDNTRSANRDVTFYKSWYDNYVNGTLNQRPDVSLTLYRMVPGGKAEPVEGYINWTWSPATADGDATNHQRIDISGLPAYDANGVEYIYYASESVMADAGALDYAPVEFDYTSIETADAAHAAGDATPALAGAADAIKVADDASADPKQDGTGWAIREDGTFVNRLESDLVANGTKLWENVPGNVEQPADLPQITVYLQRKLESDAEWPDMYANAEDRTLSGTVASTDKLTMTTNNQYTYTIDKDYEGKALPRYDENGNRYQYRAVEIAWGLLDQPGGFTSEDLEGLNISDVRDGTADNNLTGKVFVIDHGETGSFLLRNVYGGEKGKLTVKKLFSGRSQGDEYPDVTFEVWRYYVREDGSKSDAAMVASHTLTDEDFAGAGTVDPVQPSLGSNNSASYTFGNLDVYAPDGSRWAYYVVERSIDGYETRVAVGDIASAGDSQLVAGDATDGGMSSPALGTFGANGAVTGSVIANDETVDVTFANDYEHGLADLKGTKVWTDYDNIFSVRPTSLDLTFTRTAGGMTENVTTQGDDPEAENYLTWTAKGETGDWTFTLSNVEKWAPNGQPWTYKVTESLPDGAGEHYNIVTGSDTVSTANANDSFRLQNALNGQATVEKAWVDGGDPYGLRPESVRVELQARAVELDESGQPIEDTAGEWKNAYEVWKQFASEDQLAGQGLRPEGTTRTLTPYTGWRGSWQRLPLVARLTTDEPLHAIQYRVVETAIGDQPVAAPNDKGIYTTYHPYQPSQGTTYGDNNLSSTTTVTNTLESTSISATKTWAEDAKDGWATRPDGTQGTWQATFFLQRSTNGTDWEWVVETGSAADPKGSATQDGVVSLVVSGADGSDSATATWDNLPDCDEQGTPYQYRVVEQVPGGYDVTDANAQQVSDTDTAHRYYVVPSTPGAGDDDPSSQSFTNTLRTVDLTGTKDWNDFGTGVAPDFDASKAPTMTLWRAVDNDDGTFGTAEQVKKNGQVPQPTWNDDDGDDVWTFTYEGLPAANASDEPYVYWAVETAGSGGTGGFYPVYEGKGGTTPSTGSHSAAGTTVEGPATATQDGQQTNEPITNTATRLSLDKVSNWDADGQLRDIELSVQSTDGSKTYAVWQRDGSGAVTTWTLVSGGTKDQVMTDDNKMVDEAAGYVVGLPAGTYKVVETGTPPEGYAVAPEVTFKVNADGTATLVGTTHDGDEVETDADDVTNATADAVRTITVTAEDPVLRGHLQLTKRVSDDGTFDAADAEALEGATFDLYRKDVAGDADDKDELIASGLKANAQGVVTTRNNKAKISEKSSDGTFDLTYGGKYQTLADGLPEGDYYFVETNATPGAVQPEGDDAKSEVLTISQDDHFDYTAAPVSENMANEKFDATVELIKYDSTSLEGVNGAVFSLKWRPEGSTDTGYPEDLGTFTTGYDDTLKKDGVLVLPDLQKGDYLLTEVSNAGYQVGFEATFTLDNDDDGRTFAVWQDDGKAIDFQVTEGTLNHGAGIRNDRLTGQVTLRKLGDGGNSVDATFDLQVKGDDGSWATLVSDLETKSAYELAWNDDGTAATATRTGDQGTGRLLVTGLLWGTYRFQETSTQPGYLPEDENGAKTSGEFTIAADTPGMSTGVIVQNARTQLELNKQGPTGEGLGGATFSVTPVGDSAFADASTNPKTLTTDKSGLAALPDGTLVVGDTYEIYEESGPTGYDPVDATFQVRVEPDGTLSVVGGDAALPEGWERADINGDGVVENQFSFMATNQPMAVDLTKVSSADGTPLAGATFRLTGLAMDDISTHTYTTGDDGAIHIDAGLMGGVRYTLVEDVAPEGYVEMSEPLYFYMNGRGEIEAVDVDDNTLDAEGMPAGWTVEGDKISFTAENDPVELQITKRAPEGADGTEGALLPGATFLVTPVDGSAFAGASTEPAELVTDANGVARMTARLVVGGTYDITEAEAPAGYERVTGTMRVRVAADGAIEVVGSVADDGSVSGQLPPVGYEKVAENAFEVQVTNEPIEVSLAKVSATDGGTTLDGATFEVTPSDGSAFADGSSEPRELTTGADGRLGISAQLVSGDAYTIREVEAPAGYELLQGELTFEVDDDGTIAAVGDVPQGYSVEQDGVTIVAADEPLLVSLHKADEGGEPLAGATFRVTPAEGTFPDGDAEKTFLSDEDGVVFDNLMAAGSAEGTRYTVTEVSAPAGYELLPAFDLLVYEDGSVQLADDAPEAVRELVSTSMGDDGTALISASDELIAASLAKVSTDGTSLAGATFELSGVFTDGHGTRAVEVGDDGTAALDGLVAGQTYVLRETTAPEGHDLIEGEWSFVVEPDGTLTGDATGLVGSESQPGEAGYLVADDGVSLTAVDSPTPPPPGETPGKDDERPWPLSLIPQTMDPTSLTVPVVLAAVAVAFLAASLRTRRRRQS